MSKAIQGAVEIAAAVGFFAAAALIPGAAFLVANLTIDYIVAGVGLMGIGMEAGAAADALAGQRGMNITTRQAAGLRQIIRGTQRVGGTLIWSSSTGSEKSYLNKVIVIAGHECGGINALYLDGRRVYFETGGGTNTGPAGITFGGSADGNTYTGPNGVEYNFGGLVYCEARYGTQLSGDVIGGLTANDPSWAANSQGNPYVGGCTYVYLKIVADATMFPSEPEIRFTVTGKPVYDPRTGANEYSSNWALNVNDVLTDAKYGLGDNSVNQAQLIAAANVCDEQVALAGGGTESRYSLHWHYDTSTPPGDVLNTMMGAAAGRLSRIGGEWYIWPAYYQGPTASFDQGNFTDAPTWTTKGFRDLCNRVTGTYVPSNYPYNATGNLYDANGFYDGQIQDNFELAFQPTNYPQYAQDVLHGYASDEWLNADGGVYLPKELTQLCVMSIAQAQRLAKIALLRNRLQLGTGTFSMNFASYRLQPTDTFTLTFPQNGWNDKLLEVTGAQLELNMGSGDDAPILKYIVKVQETDPSIYEWSASEELTVYDTAVAMTTQVPYLPAPPTSMELTSSAATAIVQPDGTVVPRIEVTWNTPQDPLVSVIQIQYQAYGASVWTDGGRVDASLNAAYLSPVISGQAYNVRIRSLRPNGASSIWVEIDNFTAGVVLSIATQTGVGIGSLTGEAYSDGTAAIECAAFTESVGSLTLTITPTPNMLTGLNQAQLYWVYFIDPTTAGGSVTPIATQDQSDYRGKVGYFLIDSIVTPVYSTGGSSGRLSPSSFVDTGTRTTSTPTAVYDGDITTKATVSASATATSSAFGQCTWSGFPSQVSATDLTLTVLATSTDHASGTVTGTTTLSISMNIGGTQIGVVDNSSGNFTGTFAATVPSGTDLSTVSITVSASAECDNADMIPRPSGVLLGSVSIAEIYLAP